MSEPAKHTPGPYFAHGIQRRQTMSECIPITDKEDFTVALIPSWKGDKNENMEALANVSLFVAAPELLEALKYVLIVRPGNNGELTHAKAKAERAIVKAEGRAGA